MAEPNLVADCIKAMQDAPDEESGLTAVRELASELAKGVREGR
jgi:tryptophan synthase alpha chain